MKTFYIKTFGCQMNVYDGQRIESMLRGRGMRETDDVATADLIILNTCAVREKASNKVFSELGRIRDSKKPAALFGIVGCVAREEGANAFKRIPELNFVLGPQTYHKLPMILDNPDARLLNVDLSGLEKFDELPEMNYAINANCSPPRGSQRAKRELVGGQNMRKVPPPETLCVSDSSQGGSRLLPRINPLAYIPIQEGCDHCCTYCIVPFTRGREISRPFEDVMKDVRHATGAGLPPEAGRCGGAIEICFLGQNVNGYKFPSCGGVDCGEAARRGGLSIPQILKDHPGPFGATPPQEGNYTLADLIRETAKIDSVKRIRFTSSYPTEMSDDLIALFGTEPKLLPFLNMPIQSGSPSVLRRMNRPYSLDEYVDIVARLRAARPDIQISSDFIVGFPGETDSDFERTLDIIRRVRYINSYSFKYSPRPHTAAATMPDQIPENIKKRRLKILDDLLVDINREFNESCVGKTMPCLIEGADKTGKHLIARTPYMQQVIIPKDEKRKTKDDSFFVSRFSFLVKITDANKCSLRGEI
ncbi:MAG: radical SAM protein [Proteobacteria bacterium]|nr:radical SAM protein [Pseudomonadota bacterium]